MPGPCYDQIVIQQKIMHDLLFAPLDVVKQKQRNGHKPTNQKELNVESMAKKNGNLYDQKGYYQLVFHNIDTDSRFSTYKGVSENAVVAFASDLGLTPTDVNHFALTKKGTFTFTYSATPEKFTFRLSSVSTNGTLTFRDTAHYRKSPVIRIYND